jgi:hypothetical protein
MRNSHCITPDFLLNCRILYEELNLVNLLLAGVLIATSPPELPKQLTEATYCLRLYGYEISNLLGVDGLPTGLKYLGKIEKCQPLRDGIYISRPEFTDEFWGILNGTVKVPTPIVFSLKNKKATVLPNLITGLKTMSKTTKGFVILDERFDRKLLSDTLGQEVFYSVNFFLREEELNRAVRK